MDKIMPFIFYNKDCPVCGKKSSIIFDDYYGTVYDKISKAPDGVYKAKCGSCNREYIILWDIEGNPSIADKELSINEFETEFKNNEKRDLDDVLFDF